MTASNYSPVIEVTRGDIVESIHHGAIAVMDSNGRLVASYGNPDTVTFLRSSAKPFQALPFMEMEGDRVFGLTPREVALLCASHSGTDEHYKVVHGIQEKIGVDESYLLCGVHTPYDSETHKAMLLRGEKETPNRHNCSGKHTGMLAYARLLGVSTDDYINIEHPIQKNILKTFAEMCDMPTEAVHIGIDGCSVPNFAVPLRNAALAYARLSDPSGLAPNRAAACKRITTAMTSNPDMVGGPRRFDTQLMGMTNGRILTKAGAEGYQGIGLMPGALGPGSPALGIAFKIADGDLGGRARPCVGMEVLTQLGALSDEIISQLGPIYGNHPLFNWRKLMVGEIRTIFNLERHGG